jgi:hypothetical protein
MKQVIVQAGPYAGKEAIIIGLDRDILGHSIIGGSDPMSTDYVKRLAIEPVSVTSKVFIAQIDGQSVALNEYEISGKDDK